MDDVTYMRVKFYVDGSKRKGTVHVDLKKVRNGVDMNFMCVARGGPGLTKPLPTLISVTTCMLLLHFILMPTDCLIPK